MVIFAETLGNSGLVHTETGKSIINTTLEKARELSFGLQLSQLKTISTVLVLVLVFSATVLVCINQLARS